MIMIALPDMSLFWIFSNRQVILLLSICKRKTYWALNGTQGGLRRFLTGISAFRIIAGHGEGICDEKGNEAKDQASDCCRIIAVG
jgi:hypothetical protein